MTAFTLTTGSDGVPRLTQDLKQKEERKKANSPSNQLTILVDVK